LSGREVIAVCIEVASPEIMAGWLDAALMPNLAALRDRGAWADLASLSELSSGSLWPTFTTGVGPGRHGQFFTHMQLETGSYRVVKKYADGVPQRPFWAALADAGRSTAIVDVPQTRPLPGFSGVHVVGWGGEYPAWPQVSEPPQVMADILARFGPHPLAESRRIAARPDTAAKAQALHRDLVAGATAKADLSANVLDRGSFDLFLTVFAEPHWAMHLFWDNLDPTHPQHDPVRARQHASLFAEILGQIDRFIGAARARRPDADLVVFSLSGMGPNYSGWHLLPEVLARLGLGAAPAGPRKGRRQLPDLVRRMEALAPQDLLDRIKLLFPTRTWDRLARHVAFGRSGWSRCRAFCLPNDYSGAIRINLAGREPQGRVAPGADYDAVCREITDALLALVDLETGRPAVREVVRSRDVFPGERADDLPDLIVKWPGDNPLQVVGSATLGEIRLPSPERRCGAHRPTGFLLAAGPGITPGSRSGRVEIVDLAPTILHLLGLPVPAGLDGRILHELLAAEQSLEAQEVAVRAKRTSR
jgi:predicted AlkP superfamily phosphohydrolase/phosphomutase